MTRADKVSLLQTLEEVFGEELPEDSLSDPQGCATAGAVSGAVEPASSAHGWPEAPEYPDPTVVAAAVAPPVHVPGASAYQQHPHAAPGAAAADGSVPHPQPASSAAPADTTSSISGSGDCQQPQQKAAQRPNKLPSGKPACDRLGVIRTIGKPRYKAMKQLILEPEQVAMAEAVSQAEHVSCFNNVASLQTAAAAESAPLKPKTRGSKVKPAAVRHRSTGRRQPEAAADDQVELTPTCHADDLSMLISSIENSEAVACADLADTHYLPSSNSSSRSGSGDISMGVQSADVNDSGYDDVAEAIARARRYPDLEPGECPEVTARPYIRSAEEQAFIDFFRR